MEPMMKNHKLPLTGLTVGSVSQPVIVCGDPGRATKIARYLEDAKLLTDQREYRAYRGRYQDVEITVCSHGIGAPGAAIAFEELIEAGGRRIIRAGTCGSLQSDIVSGHLVIATAAVQHSGYGRETVPEGYPAVADMDLTLALRQSAAESGHPHQSGIVITHDNFYAGVKTSQTPDYQILSEANVLAVELECAALFIVGSLRGAQTAAILAVDGVVLDARESMETYAPHRDVVVAAVEAEISITLNALRNLERG
jgi:uridine phosphorylase